MIWYEWRGGSAPVEAHEPVTVHWGTYQRTYERADMVAWHNLPTDGRYRWKRV